MENCEFRRRKTSPIQLIDTENCYIRLVFTAWSVDKRQLLRHQSAGKLVNSMCFIHGVSEDSYVPSIKTIFGHYYYDQWEVLSSSTTDKIHTSRKSASFTRSKTGDLERVEHTNAFSYPLTMAISRVLKILFVKRTTKKTQHNKTKLSYLFGSLRNDVKLERMTGKVPLKEKTGHFLTMEQVKWKFSHESSRDMNFFRPN